MRGAGPQVFSSVIEVLLASSKNEKSSSGAALLLFLS